MKRIATVDKYYIYIFEPCEVVEKGCIYGVISKFRAECIPFISSFDMDFYEYTKYSAIRRARFLSLL